MKRLVVFSADAMVSEDLEYLKQLPNYKKYLAHASIVEKVRSVYPTITYPCHTTMLTGVWPNKHGILGNYQMIPGVKPIPWKWFYDWVKIKDDLFVRAKEAGYTTASVFWPVTGNHPAIDYLVDEYWAQNDQDDLLDVYRRSGSVPEVLEIVKKYANDDACRRRIHPALEKFTVGCACDIIRQFKPHLLMLHPANIDDYRHKTGVWSDKIPKGIEETDQWIGQIMEALEDAGIREETNFVLTSDHGQMETKRIVNLNVILADHGFIRVDEDGTLKDWDAWCLSGGFSSLVYLKDPNNKKIYDAVYELLKFMVSEGIYGISEVFTQKEANEKHHLGGDFAFALETDGYSSLGDGYKRPIVTNFDTSDYRYGRATHGYLPHKGPQPIFVAAGPDFKENVILPEGRLIDEAPTFAKLLGLELPQADGQAMDELLR